MSVTRRFLIVSSLGRLIRKERGGSRVTEGYFAPQGGRTSLVRIDGQQCHLVLIHVGQGGSATEERTEVPRAHGDALLDVCGGKAVYERTNVSLAPGRDAVVDRYVQPSGVDLVSVSFENEDAAKAFRPPVWFGTEVTSDQAYDRHAIALKGQPEPARLTLNNAMLDALLDLLEPRFGLGRFGGTSTASSGSRSGEGEAGSRSSALPSAQAPGTIPSPITLPASGLAYAPQATREREPETSPQPPDERLPAETGASAPSPSQSTPQPSDQSPASAGRQPNAGASDDKLETGKPDARIDDVIESLSQALGAAIQQPADGSRSDDLPGSFERWQVRPRRTQQ